ncbi:hypothetical protein ApAK_08520 [Thermoplasmatales archaeon AK]|nr:hypothetical protein [Thermoplasmatales archaeon AK]
MFIIGAAGTLSLDTDSVHAITDDIRRGSSIFAEIREKSARSAMHGHEGISIRDEKLEISGNRINVSCSAQSADTLDGVSASMDYVFQVCRGILLHYLPHWQRSAAELVSIRDICITYIRQFQKG